MPLDANTVSVRGSDASMGSPGIAGLNDPRYRTINFDNRPAVEIFRRRANFPKKIDKAPIM